MSSRPPDLNPAARAAIDALRRNRSRLAADPAGPDQPPRSARGPCAWLGGGAAEADGRPALRDCPTCAGTVRLKLFGCRHPGHAADPTTTARACLDCPDHEPRASEPDMGGLPVAMVAPGDRRPGVWRGGVLQVMVTRACNLSCFHCTAGSNLGGKPMMMTPAQFDEALASLDGYPSVVGMFGGNPAMHPQFDELCRIMRARVPFEQRGLWCNDLRGKGAHARITFNPKHSNINTHLSSAAADEFRRDWPEVATYIKGEATDSVHGSPWVAMKDQARLTFPDGTTRENTEENRWKLVGDCKINRFWSALVGVRKGELRAWFCEIAAHMAMLHEDNPDWDGTGKPMPDAGMPVVPGWWKRPMAAFEAQARLHCMNCGIPMERPGQLAIGGEKEEFSPTHAFIARPKVRERPVEIVQIGSNPERSDRPSTEYLDGTTPRIKAQ